MNIAKGASITDDEEALVEKIAQDIHPERPNARAMPAYASEGPNGTPSHGPDEESGMTAVADSTVQQQVKEGMDGEDTVRMVNADGVEVDVGIDDVKMHERSGWKRAEEDEV
jgi:hypothetical protein